MPLDYKKEFETAFEDMLQAIIDFDREVQKLGKQKFAGKFRIFLLGENILCCLDLRHLVEAHLRLQQADEGTSVKVFALHSRC